MTLKDLQTEYYKNFTASHPTIPLHAIPSKVFRDNSANELTKTIKAFCDMRGIMCQRTGNEGRYRPGKQVVDVIGRTRLMKGTYLPGQNNGQGDLCLTIKGKVHWVEVKIGRDKQSDVQKDFEAQVKRAGGVYVVVKDWAGFYNEFKKWVK